MILTYKTQIYPKEEQKQVLWDFSERCRLLYNFALTKRNIIWQQEKDKPKEEQEFITYRSTKWFTSVKRTLSRV
ncbi:MAG: hypothetical protein HeimC3_22850 [Candidatus Heimdallarchaeota archaeon LC_3]|nr:MAG: hypothetical protein HeimC3_22850 [Candidatus Heimdallarchaeota archaeon LC_3]